VLCFRHTHTISTPLGRHNDRRIEEVADNVGSKTWIIPDGFLPEHSNGHFVSHEAVCVLNLTDQDAHLTITVYFEDREPMTGFTATCGARRTNHVRLDKIVNSEGQKIPVGVPYALKVDSNQPVIIQHSRMDTTQAEMALMTTIAYPL